MFEKVCDGEKNVKLQRPLIVLTTDFRFFSAISRELRRRRVEFDTIILGDPVPSNAIILTTLNELEEVNITYGDAITVLGANPNDFPSYEHLIARLFASIHGKKYFKHISIGIDPGLASGIIVEADGLVLVAETMPPVEIGSRLRKILKHFIAITTTVKIGGGAPNALASLINSITESCPETLDLIEWVDESGTTSSESEPEAVEILTKDEASALKISRRKGQIGPIPDFTKNITQGMIKEIQNWSRQISQNKITISQELARKVLKGEISLKAAIKLQSLRGNETKNQKNHQ